MYPLDITTCTALDVIQRSMTCHPSMLLESLEARAKSDRAYLAQGGHSRKRRPSPAGGVLLGVAIGVAMWAVALAVVYLAL